MSATVTIPGYTLSGVAGIGAQGSVRRGTDPAGEAVAIRVIAHAPGGLRARAEAAAQVRHPGVAAVRELVPAGGGLAVVHDFIEGPTLATLRAARRGLSLPECAQLAAELLAALAALHAAGIIHGDVSPANVIVTPGAERQGRPVLVDLVGGAGAERGTRGFQAPEVAAGAALGTAADVYAAAQVALWAAEPGARSEVASLVGPLLAADPGQRPSARRAAQMLDGAAHQAIELAPAEVLASATLREHAARELTTRARQRRSRPRRRHRARRRQWVLRAGAGVLFVVAVLGASIGTGLPDRLLTGADKAGVVGLPAGAAVRAAQEVAAAQPGAQEQPEHDAQETAPAPTGGPDLAAAVHDLFARRDAALLASDAVALAEVTVPGSALAASDAALLAELTDSGVRLRDYRTEVQELAVVQVADRSAVVRTELVQRAHERVSAQGTVREVDAQPPQCLQLRLERTPDTGTWRAARAAPC